MPEPPEPTCPPDRKPHHVRVRDIDAILPEGKTGAVCIDNTPEHRAWYMHEIGKYHRLEVVYEGALNEDVYIIKVRKLPAAN